MRASWVLLAAAAWIGWQAPAAAQGAGGQQRFTVDGDALLEVSQPQHGGDANPVRLRIELHLTVAGNTISGSMIRSVLSKNTTYPRVVLSDHSQLSVQLGRAVETKKVPGHGVAVLSGNKLTLLQALKTGAVKVTITMGAGCGLRIDYVREVGKGNTQTKGTDGKDIEISRARQVSSTCRITRGG
jgi:hypothetical protein